MTASPRAHTGLTDRGKTDRRNGEAGRDDEPRPEPANQHWRHQRTGNESERRRQCPQPGDERRLAENELEVLRDEQERPEVHHERQCVRAQGCDERRTPEQLEVDQGIRQASLATSKHDRERDTRNDRDDRRNTPTILGEVLEAVDDCENGHE